MNVLLIDVILLVRSWGLKWSGRWRFSLLSASFFFPLFSLSIVDLIFSVLLQLLFVLSSFLWIGLHRAYNFFIANSWWWPLTSHGWYHIYMCFVLWASFFQLWVGKMWFLLHFITFFDSIPHCYVHGLTFWNTKKNSKSDKNVILLPLIMVYMLHATYLILGERSGWKIQAIFFFIQFSTIVGGDENWRRQLRKT